MILTGCTLLKPGRGFEEVSRRLLKLSSYTCDVTMRVANNKSIMEYKLKHYFKSPDKYKVEVLAPKELEGQITIYNGSRSYIYHPRIDQYLVTENFSGSVEYNSFMGSFMEHIKKTDDIRISSEKQGEKELFIVEFDISEPNNYMQHEKIWFDAEDIVPLKAEIYGTDGRTNVQIHYSNFVYNPGLADGDFEITQKNQ
jgi:outer membrane lipoprotein-sorting protein